MEFRHVQVEAFGYVLPECVVTSGELERRLAPIYDRFHLHEGRLELMSGIRERRLWEPGTLPSDAAARAGRRAMNAAGVVPDEIECLLHTAVSRDFLEPATASVVHHHLGLSPRAMVYDISNACLGFLNGMLNLANMIELGQARRGLIVAGESSRPLVETTIASLLSDPSLTKAQLKAAFASLTIGSGAAAVVMAHDSVAHALPADDRPGGRPLRLLGGVVRADTTRNDLCRGTADTGFGRDAQMLMNTDSETLLVQGCDLAARTWADFKKLLGWDNGGVDRCFTHQVGVAHRQKLYEVIGVDPAKDFSTLEFLGNVGSVSLPLTMAMGLEKRPAAPGERIALLGIGSGLNCIMLGVTP